MRETHFSERAAKYFFSRLEIDSQAFCKVRKQSIQWKPTGENLKMHLPFFGLLFDFGINTAQKIMCQGGDNQIFIGTISVEFQD